LPGGAASSRAFFAFTDLFFLTFVALTVKGEGRFALKTQQVIITDRRQRPREGVTAEIETLTYIVLRRYGIS
jgi:hypothetical protein